MLARARLVSLLLFGSGFCALIYQTAWLREFRLLFGSSTAASAAVLGVFMAGLGFGGIFLGRRSETKAHPLTFYGRLELLIAGSAALSPLLIFAARQLYIALGGTTAMGMPGGTLARLILAGIIIGTPTFLMGGTLPAAARAAVSPDDTSRRTVGVLYGANTLGAVTGAVAGTFYFFERFGNHITLWLAAALNIVVALMALRVSKLTPEPEVTSKASRESAKQESGPAPSRAFVFGAAGIVGFAFFLMELVWYRMLGPLLGGSTFSFGLILATALLGIGMGGAGYAVFGLKRPASLEFFAITCAAEAFFIALPYALGDRIALAAMLLRPLGTLGFYGHVIAWTALCLIVVFPAAFMAGLQFPLLIALLGKGTKSIGSQIGAAYAWNTIGALIGSLAGGFGFMPMFTAPGVWKIVTVLLSALAMLAVILNLPVRGTRLRAITPTLIVVVALWMLAATGPTAFWRHSQIGVGRLRLFQISPNQVRDLINGKRRQIEWETEGIESSVALSKGDGLAFIVNGKSDGSAKGDAGTQIMCGLIAAALHPHPSKAMVIGLGTGSTAGWLAAIPSVRQVDAVELEPAVVKVAQECGPVNHGALLNPKLKIIIGDAREVLLTRREKYDIIASEPSNPYRAGVAGLFTREYYRSVDRCLEPGGIFCQWIQAYDVDDRTTQIFYRTLATVFPSIESWQTGDGDLLLVASRSPLRYDAPALRARLSEEPFKSGLLAAWRANGLEDFLAHYVGNTKLGETFQQIVPGPINTDDRTVIEFALARSIDLTNGFQLANLRMSSHEAHTDRPAVDGEVDWLRVDNSRLSLYPDLSRAAQLRPWLTSEQRFRAAAFLSYAAGDLPAALRQWRAQGEEPQTPGELMLVAECLAAQGDNAALPYVEKLAAVLPLEAQAIRAELLWRDYKPEESIKVLEEFFEALRKNPWPNRELIRRTLTRAEQLGNSDRSKTGALVFYNALRNPLALFINESQRVGTLLALGIYLDGDHPGQYTQTALEAFEPNVLWERKFLEIRKACYDAMNNPRAEQARRDLADFMAHEAATADLSALTQQIEDHSGDSSSAVSKTPADETNANR